MSGLDILYVDDDPDIRTIAVLSLRLDPGVAVRSAASGDEALRALQDAPDWIPDVMLLDVMMPGMDGPALAREIRAMPHLRDVPLIFMTARTRESDVQGYLDIGRASVIAKPFDPLALVEEVRTRLAAIG